MYIIIQATTVLQMYIFIWNWWTGIIYFDLVCYEIHDCVLSHCLLDISITVFRDENCISNINFCAIHYYLVII